MIGRVRWVAGVVRRLVRHLGLVGACDAGCRLAWMRWMAPRGAVVSLPWRRGCGARVHCRAGTSDVLVYRQLLLDDELRGLCLGTPRTILDAGANIGLATIEFATTFPEARIVSVEPDPENLVVLRRNVAPFGTRVTVVSGAVWSRPARLSITNPGGDAWLRRVDEDPDGLVAAFDVAELTRRLAPPAPFELVKLDVEGAERAVFAGDLGWLRDARVVGVELHDWMVPGCAEAVLPHFPAAEWRGFESGEYRVFERVAPPA